MTAHSVRAFKSQFLPHLPSHPTGRPRIQGARLNVRKTVSAAAVALAVSAGAAGAHGDAAWIMENPSYSRYEEPKAHCCGPEHCAVAPPGKFEEVPGGVRDRVTGRVYLKSNGTGVYLSKDDNWWWCWTWQRGVGGTGIDGTDDEARYLTCVFKPYRGM